MIRLTLRRKLLIISTFLAVIPLAIAATRMIGLTRVELISNANDELRLTANQIAREVDDRYQFMWYVPLALIRDAVDNPSLSIDEKISILQEGSNAIPDLLSLQFTVDGLEPALFVRQEIKRQLDAAELQPATVFGIRPDEIDGLLTSGRNVSSKVVYEPDLQQWMTTIVLPLHTPINGRAATLSARMTLNNVKTRIKNDPFNQKGRILLIDSSGRRILQPDQPTIRDWPHVENALNMMKFNTTSVQSYPAPNGETVIGSHMFLTYFDWAVLVERPEAEAYLTVQRMFNQLLLWIGLGLIAAVIMALFFSNHISRPVKHLADKARGIAKGDFSQRAKVESHDEIGELAEVFNNMAQQLQLFEDLNIDRLVSEKSKIETLVKNMADGVIVTDDKQRIIIVNRVAEEWFGTSELDAFELPLSAVIHNRGLIDLIQQAESSSDMVSGEIEVKVAGSARPFILGAHAAKVSTPRRVSIGVITVLRDITREKEIDRMKTELVSLTAHELRTPITAIAGFSQILTEDTSDPAQTAEFSGIIYKESLRLSDMINKFLDISRIESGRQELQHVPVMLNQILLDVLDVNEQMAAEKNIRVERHVPADVSLLEGDPDLLGQVFLNLFSNAVKYSPDGTTITVSMTEEDGTQTVRVHDQGYGILEEDLPHIFDKFYRVKNDKIVKEITGTGLGLPLVKEIVEQHGGSIFVESELRQGSIFGFSLPIPNDDDPTSDNSTDSSEGHAANA